MTKEEAKKLLPIIQAVAEGKTIQQRTQVGYEDEWIDTNLPLVVIPSDYRIKPEVKYRPFKTKEECWDEMHKHPDFGWIVSKKDNEYCHIGGMFISESNSFMIVLSIDEISSYEADKYFDNYTFTDGKPFGIEEN